MTARGVRMAPGVYCIEIPTPFHVGSVNVYVLKEEHVTLVDVGPLTEEAWETLQEGLASIGIRMEEIKQIILTHHHVDHCGLLERVRRVSGACTLAHPLARPYVQLPRDLWRTMMNFSPICTAKAGCPLTR